MLQVQFLPHLSSHKWGPGLERGPPAHHASRNLERPADADVGCCRPVISIRSCAGTRYFSVLHRSPATAVGRQSCDQTYFGKRNIQQMARREECGKANVVNLRHVGGLGRMRRL